MADQRTQSQKKTDAALRDRVYQILTANGISRRVISKLQMDGLMRIMRSTKMTQRQKEKAAHKAIAIIKKGTAKTAQKEMAKFYADHYEKFLKSLEAGLEEDLDRATKKALKEAFDKDYAAAAKMALEANNGATPAQMYNSTYQAFENNIRALILNEFIEDFVPAITMTQAIKKFRRDLESSIRTQTFAMISEQEDRLYSANSDVVRGIMFSAVLDGRTTQFCKGIDGTIVTLQESKTFKAPFHVNCRTANIPVLEDESDAEARDALNYRSRVGAGPGYEEGSSVQDKKPTAANTKRNLKKNPDGTYKRDADGNYQRTKPKKGSKPKIKVTEGSAQSTKSSSYGDFLQSQINTAGGSKFIRDAMGKTRGNAFIREMKANPGKDAQKVLQKVLKAPIEDLKKAA